MKINEAFPSEWAQATDLDGRAVTATIVRIEQRKMRDLRDANKQVEKFVMYVKGGEKGIILSRRLAKQISEVVGDDEMNNWNGKIITLFPDWVKAFGKDFLVFCARKSDGVFANDPQAAPQTAPPARDEPQPTAFEYLDEDPSQPTAEELAEGGPVSPAGPQEAPF